VNGISAWLLKLYRVKWKALSLSWCDAICTNSFIVENNQNHGLTKLLL